MNVPCRSRNGFTLVEVLVVLALIVILAGMTVVFMPNAVNSEREARAATLLQGWLNIAKQRAMREQAPRGLRLWVGTTLSGSTTVQNVVTQCQYITQADDFVGTPIISAAGQTGGMQIIGDVPQPAVPPFTPQNTIGFYFPPLSPLPNKPFPGRMPNTGTLLGGYLPYNPADQPYWYVQPGDYIEVGGTGLMHRIVKVGVPDGTGKIHTDYIFIDPPLDWGVSPAPGGNQTTWNYRIVRMVPRPLGNDELNLPDGTVVDLGTNLPPGAWGGFPGPFNNPLPIAPPPALPPNLAAGSYLDILFSPTGAVITQGVTTNTMNLWVRAVDENGPANVMAGKPTIVAVHVTTGAVGAYPAPSTGMASPNPYHWVQ